MKKSYGRAQQVINTFDDLYTNCYQDILIDEKEIESLFNVCTKHVNGNKEDFFSEKRFTPEIFYF